MDESLEEGKLSIQRSNSQDRRVEAAADLPSTNGQSELYKVGKSTTRWINSWKEKSHGRRSSKSFKYTAIEMDEYTTGAPPYAPSRELSASAATLSSFEGDEPTEEERQTLRKVADKMPWSAFLVAMIELCERFTYYGLSGPFQNYIQNSYHDVNGLPGAIGLGETGATSLTDFFQCWCYITPIFGAIVSDQYLGKYKTILYFAYIYLAGVIVLFSTSLPIAIESGFALPGLIVAMIVIGLGTGGIKSNVSPLVAEQYRGTKQTIHVEKSGGIVIVDPGVTIQRIYMIFYLCINVGSLSGIATTELEKQVGFWAAYLLCLCMFFVGITILLTGKQYYFVRPPQGSVIVHSLRAMWIGLLNKGNMDAAKPSHQQRSARRYKTPWTDDFITSLTHTLRATRVFLFYSIYWIAYSQMLNNFISQAGTMRLHSLPNDIMSNIDSLALILLIPLFSHLIYPFLHHHGFPLPPITRITLGFLSAAAAMAYASWLQHRIYTSPPCYTHPLHCPAAPATEPNNVHILLQTPAYILLALSEIFAGITGLEYAYTKAPPSMKSFVMAIFLLQSALGSAMGAALAPLARDPWLVWLYGGIGVGTAGMAGVFWWVFGGQEGVLDRGEREYD